MSQKALNRVLTLKSSGGGPELPESSRILEKRFDLRRVMTILLQRKNFGANVIYNMLPHAQILK